MATYRSISDTEYSVDAPLTTQLVQAIDENATAITEGASGAPKIQTAAYDANSVNQAAIESSIKAKYLIESVTMSSATHTFAAVSGYDRYKIEWEFSDGGGNLGLRVGNGSPSTGFDYTYTMFRLRGNSTATDVYRDSNNDSMFIGLSPKQSSGYAYIMSAHATSNYTFAKFVCANYPSTFLEDISGSAVYRVKNNANVFQIGAFGVGAAVTGTARLYGYRS